MIENRFQLLGVHPIDADEPCHLIEVRLDDVDIDWGSVTQPISDQPQENWQVAYDEQQIDAAQNKWAFFFHYLDVSKPLRTQFGEVLLPNESPVPAHLKTIQYFPP